jgi:hypothetical protein
LAAASSINLLGSSEMTEVGDGVFKCGHQVRSSQRNVTARAATEDEVVQVITDTKDGQHVLSAGPSADNEHYVK